MRSQQPGQQLTRLLRGRGAAPPNQLPPRFSARIGVVTYSDLLLCFIFILLVYLLMEVKELRNLVAYYMELPRQDGE
jgi:hypothetical protein